MVALRDEIRSHAMQIRTPSHSSKGCPKIDVKESEMPREAAKKIMDLMVKHGAEQNAVLTEI
jgi:hypothetical protein